MMSRLLLFATVAVVSATVSTVAQYRSTIDLRGPVDVLARPAECLPNMLCQDVDRSFEVTLGVGSSPTRDVSKPAPQLLFKIESLDRDVLEYGDKVLVTMSIRNTGDQIVTLPWSRSPEYDKPEWQSRLLLILKLQLDIPGVDPYFVSLGVLYGSEEDAVSILRLRPGETVEIVSAAHLVNWPATLKAEAGRNGVEGSAQAVMLFNPLRNSTQFTDKKTVVVGPGWISRKSY